MHHDIGSKHVNTATFEPRHLVAGLLAEVQLDRQSLSGGCSGRRLYSRQRGTLTPVFTMFIHNTNTNTNNNNSIININNINNNNNIITTLSSS